MAYNSLQLLLALCLLRFGESYPSFQQNIPNGEIVPSPCNPNHVWRGVGHKVKGGGGERNQFGIDFDENGYTWTEELCRMDSDGDGKTNGEELGDPNCNWSKGATPQTSLGLSHPGICEPLGSSACQGKNDFIDCATEDFKCNALSDPDIVSHTVRLSESDVPAEETTYICQVLDVPSDKDYHLVAAEPYIDNVNVMHHIIVYGCSDKANITQNQREPNKCFMNRVPGCEEMVAIWAVGQNGMCYHEDAGFKLGMTGYKKVLIEMHWNNPMKVDTYRDSSGMTLHLTPNLRPNEAGMMMIGQAFLMIPPGREKYSVNSSCSSECTNKKMIGNVNVIGALNHMHYLGMSAVTKAISNDKEEHVIADDPKYSYDSPVFYVFDEPLTLEPGYELQLHCDFKSTSRSKTTFFGEGTYDEMCFAFLMYYPKNNWLGGDCVTSGPIDSCEWEEGYVDGCDLNKLGDPTDQENIARYTALQENCRVGVCLEECKEVVREIFRHPCFQSPLKYMMQDSSLTYGDQSTKHMILEYYYRMDSCAAELAMEKCDGNDG
ncbi:dopamine beta-hydroxylase-like [Mercenaria mercenaria]|uniref:dopamine beta-hydroxylase-like n=1 Tax=Mercenaria mercenaria TaxID=6596 RepID=UPI00234F9957|nr:dopamine beta-hydroxylase-like [Mercenaria mercenaria]